MKTYRLGISSQILNTVYAPQQKEYWCWTASITNILRAYGITNITQEEFAKKVCGVDIYNNAYNCPATDYQITRSLNFWGYDQNYNYFKVKAPLIQSTPNLKSVLNELNNRRPILVAFQDDNMQMGHAVIITGCEYGFHNGKTYVTKLFIRDPSPQAPNRIMNGRQEINNVRGFLNSIYAHWYVRIYND